MNDVAENIFSFGNFELSGARRQLLKDGEIVALNAKTFDLLLALVENHERVLTKEELLEKVWEGQFVEENNLSVQIAALRKALGERKGENRFLLTVPGKGYKFIAELDNQSNGEIVIENRKIERITIDEELAETTPEVKKLAGVKTSKRGFFVFGASCLLIIAIGFLAFLYYRTAPPTQINSLAVLPFANQNAETDYLSDGLTESVIYSLSQTPNLKIMSRNTVFRYKGKDTDAQTIGKELNVQAVLTGSINQRGEQLDISAELVSTNDNSIIWGEKFTRRLSDLEKLQNDIAVSITDRLRLKISGVKHSETENAEAYRLYLKGLYQLNKRTESGLKQSVELFQKAIETDPSYAKAYAGLAMAYNVIPGNLSMPHEEANDWRLKATVTAQKALEFDGALAEAYAVLGDQKRVEWDFAAAENNFKRAIELNPNLASAHQWYSEYLSRLTRHDEALAEIKKAYELDPLSPAVAMNIGLRYADAGRMDEAVAQYKRLIADEPAYPMPYLFLGDIYADKGMYEDALESWCKGDVLLKIDSAEKCEADNVEVRKALKTNGAAGFWRKILEQGFESYERGILTEINIAGIYARLGDNERAFEWLEKAFAKHEEALSGIKIDTAFVNLKNDARFKDLLRRIGLPE